MTVNTFFNILLSCNRLDSVKYSLYLLGLGLKITLPKGIANETDRFGHGGAY